MYTLRGGLLYKPGLESGVRTLSAPRGISDTFGRTPCSYPCFMPQGSPGSPRAVPASLPLGLGSIELEPSTASRSRHGMAWERAAASRWALMQDGPWTGEDIVCMALGRGGEHPASSPPLLAPAGVSDAHSRRTKLTTLLELRSLPPPRMGGPHVRVLP